MSDFDLPKNKIETLLHESAERAMEHWPGNLLHGSESPIEHMFLLAAWARGAWIEELVIFHPGASVKRLTQACIGSAKTICAQQVQIGPHRVDFLFVRERADNEPPCYVVVECDGHEFHEKTKEQAARDKSRDRDLTNCGMTVMRFTGSEIWADAGACAQEVLTFLSVEWIDSGHRMLDRIAREKETGGAA